MADEKSPVVVPTMPGEKFPVVVPTIVVSTPSSITKAPSNPVPATPPKPRPSRRSFSSIFSALKCTVNSSEKRAKKSAYIIHDLINGPDTSTLYTRPRLSTLKSQLIKPKSANKLLVQLRALPTSYGTPGPIHAVSLARPDAEIQKLHFSALSGTSFLHGSASLDQVSDMFSKMDIVNLVSHPSLGIGEPGNGQGLLSGALPTAETVLKGFQEITPQLMALGYATGKSVLIDHTGVYPPTDRMSVLTYWWGLELVLPPPSLKHLASVHSISGTLINFLTALALLNNGIRELLPFIRYISQFIDYEFAQITREDRGEGVVCAATWIMPAALVPRPWDFVPPPPPPPAPVPAPATTKDVDSPPAQPATPAPAPETTKDVDSSPNANAPPAQPASPAPAVPAQPQPTTTTTPTPGIIPPSLTNLADTVIGAYKDSVTFQPEVAAASKAHA